MSVVEDVRQVLQDFLAPELRSINVRLTAVEARLIAVEARFDTFEKHIDARFDRMEATFSTKIGELSQALSLDKRLSRVEEKTGITPS
jgi:hypothetical protein